MKKDSQSCKRCREIKQIEEFGMMEVEIGSSIATRRELICLDCRQKEMLSYLEYLKDATKICKKCGEDKHISEFRTMKNTLKDNTRNICRNCENSRRREKNY